MNQLPRPDVIKFSNPKPKFVIFEGADKVGKTTLFRSFRALTHYIPLAIDRFTGSNIVYDLYYNRKTSINAYLDIETEIQEIMDCYLVVLTCDEETLLERIKRGEEGKANAVALDNYVKINELFLNYFDHITNFSQILCLNTGYLDEDECMKTILNFTKEESGS